MGWLSLIVVYPLAVKLAVGGNVAGGWRGGVLCWGHLLRLQTYSYNHAIWHGFVLGGSVSPGDLFDRPVLINIPRWHWLRYRGYNTLRLEIYRWRTPPWLQNTER